MSNPKNAHYWWLVAKTQEAVTIEDTYELRKIQDLWNKYTSNCLYDDDLK